MCEYKKFNEYHSSSWPVFVLSIANIFPLARRESHMSTNLPTTGIDASSDTNDDMDGVLLAIMHHWEGFSAEAEDPHARYEHAEELTYLRTVNSSLAETTMAGKWMSLAQEWMDIHLQAKILEFDIRKARDATGALHPAASSTPKIEFKHPFETSGEILQDAIHDPQHGNMAENRRSVTSIAAEQLDLLGTGTSQQSARGSVSEPNYDELATSPEPESLRRM